MVAGVDLLVPGVGELCGGSLRESSPQAIAARYFLGTHTFYSVLVLFLQLKKQEHIVKKIDIAQYSDFNLLSLLKLILVKTIQKVA